MVIRQVELESSTVRVLDEGEGQPLLLVHGFPLDHTMWAGQLDYFASRYRVLAPDLPGFGQSGPISEASYSMAAFANDLASLLDQLRVTEQVIFCGLSMGGYVGWQFWRHHRNRLGALIQCDTRALADTEEVAKGRRYMAERALQQGSTGIAEEMVSKLFAPSTLAADPAFVKQSRDVMQATRRETIAAAQRGMAERPDLTPLLGEIDHPTLLLGGENDPISPPSEMQAIAEAMSHAKFVCIPAAGHMAPLEQPSAVNRAIDEFLADLQ